MIIWKYGDQIGWGPFVHGDRKFGDRKFRDQMGSGPNESQPKKQDKKSMMILVSSSTQSPTSVKGRPGMTLKS